MTDEHLTAIYNEANGIDGGKNPPITTQRIFAAMRLIAEKEQERCAQVCDEFQKTSYLTIGTTLARLIRELR